MGTAHKDHVSIAKAGRVVKAGLGYFAGRYQAVLKQVWAGYGLAERCSCPGKARWSQQVGTKRQLIPEDKVLQRTGLRPWTTTGLVNATNAS